MKVYINILQDNLWLKNDLMIMIKQPITFRLHTVQADRENDGMKACNPNIHLCRYCAHLRTNIEPHRRTNRQTEMRICVYRAEKKKCAKRMPRCFPFRHHFSIVFRQRWTISVVIRHTHTLKSRRYFAHITSFNYIIARAFFGQCLCISYAVCIVHCMREHVVTNDQATRLYETILFATANN